MEQQPSHAEAEYFGLADMWDEELYGKLKRDRLIALIVAGVAILLAALAVIAVMLLTPLKTVVPYMILVDKTTGHSEVVTELRYNADNPLTEKETFVLAEINNYVIARHTFDTLDINRRYNSVRMSTAVPVFNTYLQELNKDTEKFTADTRRIVTIKTIVPNLANKTAQIRFSTKFEGSNSPRDSTRDWIATMDYDFVSLNLPLKDRYINPLGFIVKGYRSDPETFQ